MTCTASTLTPIIYASANPTLKPPLLRLHTLPPSIGAHKISDLFSMDRRPPLGSYHAARRGSPIRPLDVEVRKETTFHDRRLHLGRRGSIDARLDIRACGFLNI